METFRPTCPSCEVRRSPDTPPPPPRLLLLPTSRQSRGRAQFRQPMGAGVRCPQPATGVAAPEPVDEGWDPLGPDSPATLTDMIYELLLPEADLKLLIILRYNAS